MGKYFVNGAEQLFQFFIRASVEGGSDDNLWLTTQRNSKTCQQAKRKASGVAPYFTQSDLICAALS